MTEPNKYLNSKIYKITNSVNEECYIGTTILTLKYTLSHHLSRAKSSQYSCSSNILLKGDNVHIVLLENYPCNSYIELKNRKRYWIDKNDTVNAVKHPVRSIQDETVYRSGYYDRNRDKYINTNKIYYNENKEGIRARVNKRVQCSYCEKEYSTSNKISHYKNNHPEIVPPKNV